MALLLCLENNTPDITRVVKIQALVFVEFAVRCHVRPLVFSSETGSPCSSEIPNRFEKTISVSFESHHCLTESMCVHSHSKDVSQAATFLIEFRIWVLPDTRPSPRCYTIPTT